MFPFGLPAATSAYLAVYLVTLAVHLALTAYVVAGAGYLAVVGALGLLRRPGDHALSPAVGCAAARLCDWLPFALGAAITAGVAPLLFVQVLYQESFYTANLLLFYEWMAIVPALIVGFYVLYLEKSPRVHTWPPILRAALPIFAFMIFLFVAHSWTENHLLSVDPAAWTDFYASDRHLYRAAELWPRLGFWISTAVAVMPLLLGWQCISFPGAQLPAAAKSSTAAHLAMLAAGGVLAAIACGAWYAITVSDDRRTLFASRAAAPHLAIAATGAVVYAAGWIWQLRRRALRGPALALSSVGAAGLLLAVLAVREVLRLGALDPHRLAELHQRARDSGGFAIFVASFVVNAAVIIWCLVATRRSLRASGSPPR